MSLEDIEWDYMPQGMRDTIKEYIHEQEQIIDEARHVCWLFFNRGGTLSAYCKRLKEMIEKYDADRKR